MRRRTVLRHAATAGVGGTAGCTDLVRRARGELEVDTGFWPRTTFDREGTSAHPGVEGPTTEPSITWPAETPIADGYDPAIVVADDTAYVHRGSTVTAVSIPDGTRAWQHEIELDGRHRPARPYRSAAVRADHLYLGTERGLTELSRDGDGRW